MQIVIMYTGYNKDGLIVFNIPVNYYEALYFIRLNKRLDEFRQDFPTVVRIVVDIALPQ